MIALIFSPLSYARNSEFKEYPAHLLLATNIDKDTMQKNMQKKLVWKPSTMLYPLPVVMVTCQAGDERPNIITVAWAGTICSDPPMLSISVRPERHSHGILLASREFVVNVPSSDLAFATDYCGVASGRDKDKFAEAKLTPAPASVVGAPLIAECPLHLECKVTETKELGSHTMFLAEVVAVQAAEKLMDRQNRLALEKAGLLTYVHGHYYSLGKQLGHFGFSVRKKSKKKPAKRTKRK
jgi:flavin reductase (DIM6/NTAB) family NADH-FMN oxidoreductase RutF